MSKENYLVAFDYTDDACQHFSELVSMTKDERERVQRALDHSESEGLIMNWYCGKPQTKPTPFAEFWRTLEYALDLGD